MKFQDLNANVRTTAGNSPARQLRMKGLVPAVIYGRGKAGEMLSVNFRELEKVMKHSKSAQVMLNLTISNGNEQTTRPVMIKELQSDTVTREFLHVDFYEVDMTRKLRAKVPVAIKGKAIGVENGGMLQVVRHNVEVLCLPDEIPEEISIDVTDLHVGGSIHVKDIPLEGNLEIPADINYTIVTCLGTKAEAGATTEGGQGAAAAETAKS